MSIATPATVARVIAARTAREAIIKPVFSTSTGEDNAALVRQQQTLQRLGLVETVYDEAEVTCGVCSRMTNHVAEHDDLIEQGVAYYSTNGSVCLAH